MRFIHITTLFLGAVFWSPVTILASANLGETAAFVAVDPGEFEMGRAFSIDDILFEGPFRVNTPLHKVIISQGFEIQTTEVTQGQWYKVMGENPSRLGRDLSKACPEDFVSVGQVGICPNHPVDAVSWKLAQDYITKLNKKNDGYAYRLPTEEEWEYAARAGTDSDFCFGNDIDELKNYGWYKDNSTSRFPSRVASLRPNAWGLYDMHGNVSEWVQDNYEAGPNKVIRGGNRTSLARHVRSSSRGFANPLYGAYLFGFRLVRAR